MRKHKQLLTEESKMDPGFGTLLTEQAFRLINTNGEFNIKKAGQEWQDKLNVFHSLITMSWRRFMTYTFVFYVFLNIVFALGYVAIGLEHLEGISSQTSKGRFWEAFFFSAQTLTTVGYGRISPVGFAASLLSAIEALAGLMVFALITGILYGRFSRPKARVKFSDVALISPFKDGMALMIRMVNKRSNQMFQVSASLLLTWIEYKDEKAERKYFNLPLDRKEITFFALNWTIVHKIDEQSPLWGKTQQELLDLKAEFIVSLEGTQDTFSEKVYTRSSYKAHELVWNAKFQSMMENPNSSAFYLNLNKINDHQVFANEENS